MLVGMTLNVSASVISGGKKYPLINILETGENSWSVSANSALQKYFPSFCKQAFLK